MAYRAWSSNGGPRILRVPKWQLVLILMAALAVGIAVAIVAGLAYRLFGKHRRAPGNSIIEGEYEVIDAAPAGPRPGRSRS